MNVYKQSSWSIPFVFLCLLLLVVPIISFPIQFTFYAPELLDSLYYSGLKKERFIYSKQITLLLLSSLFVISYMFSHRNRTFSDLTLHQRSQYSFLLVFVVSLFVSLFFSAYPTVAFYGIFMRGEGTVTYLLYAAIFFGASQIELNKKRKDLILYIFGSFVAMNAVIAVSNYSGVPLYDNVVLRFLFQIEQNTGLTIPSTLGASNITGGISGVFTVLFFVAGMLAKNTGKTIFYMIVSLVSFSLVLLNLSSGSFISIVVSMPILLWMGFKSEQRKKTIIYAITTVILFTSVWSIAVQKNHRVFYETIGPLFGKTTENTLLQYPKGQEISSPYLPHFPDKGVSGGNGREYIWKKTIELIKEKPMTGYGLETLIYTFNHYDIEQYSHVKSVSRKLSSPHNLYLEIAYGAGIPALIGFLGIVGVYLWCSFRRLVAEQEIQNNFFAYAILAGVFVFLVQATVNDSTIGAGVIFWGLLGIGASVHNHEE